MMAKYTHCFAIVALALSMACSDSDDDNGGNGSLPDVGQPDATGQADATSLPDATGMADAVAQPDATSLPDASVGPDATAEDASGQPDAASQGPKYTIDGDLSDWTNPIATITNDGFGVPPDNCGGAFGGDNRIEQIWVDGDSNYFYIGYQYRASGNSSIIHLDTVTGGESSAGGFEAWPRLVTFANPIDRFIAQFEGQDVQVRTVMSDTSVPEISETFMSATMGTGPGYTSELAIPWTALGLSGASANTFRIHAGIYGGDNFGAGDIAPNACSTPADANNAIDNENSFAVDFQGGWEVTAP